MGKQLSTAAGTRYHWRWALLLVGGLAWLSIGCSPQSLSMLIMPFTDTNIQPEYKLFEKDREITLVILSRFDQPAIHPDLIAADAELAGYLANALRKRCADNKHKIKIVHDAQVRGELLNSSAGGELRAVEIGKKFKADYVLDLTINSFSLYEPGFSPPFFRGRTDIATALYKVDVKEGDHRVFYKDFRTEYPSTGPVEAGNVPGVNFRNRFLPAVARDLSRVFISYPPEERRNFE